jgi:hypothetical protein
MRRISIPASTALAIGAVLIAAAALASPALAGRQAQSPAVGTTLAQVTSPATGISVHGTGKVTLVPDTAIVVLGVDVRDTTAAAAQSHASTLMNAVIAAVKGHGIADADMATVNISLGAVYDYSTSTQKLVGWEASQSLSVKDRRLGDTGSLVDDAVSAGATNIQGISLTVADQSAAANQARALAVADATAKAQALAKAANVTLGPVETIDETSSPSPVPVAEAMPAAGKALDASLTIVPGSFDVTVDVDMTFGID